MGIRLGIRHKAIDNRTKNIFIHSLIITISFWLLVISSFSQENIKSKKIETIEGKKYYIHTIEKSQTLYAIAKIYEVSINEIVIENPEAIDGINPGQILRIPLTKPKKEKTLTKVDSSNFIFHKVEPKQTLYSISKNYNVSIQTLNTINPELKDGLKIGQIIKIPNDKKTIKEERKKLITEDQKPIDEISKKPAIELLSLKDSTKIFKNEYKIALFLPFNLGENTLTVDSLQANNGSKFSNKTKLAIEFYEGVKMAVDSMSKSKFKCKLFVYDTDEFDSTKLESTLKKPELATMDLIIGPIYSSSFMTVAKFAKEHQIAIVSPLSQLNKVLLSNTYASKASASATTQLEQIAKYIIDNYSKENIIVINNTSFKELPYITTFTKTASELLSSKASKDTIKEFICNGKDYNLIENKFSTSTINIVVVPLIYSQAFVTELISNLYTLKEKYKIIVFGTQSWTNYNNLDIDYLNALSLHLPVNFYIDYSDFGTKNFIKKYRNNYKTEPSTYVYQGFDVTYCYLKGLQKYGLLLYQKLPEMNEKGIQTAFNFYKTSIESGYENRFCYILKYKDYKITDATKE